MNKTNKPIWEYTWGYIEGFYVAFGIALSGFLLQIVIGNLQLSAFQYPVNLIIGVIFIVTIVFCHFLFKRTAIVRWLSSVYSTVPAIVVLLGIVILLGIVPQFVSHATHHDIPH